jgi:glycosyltransferase involved in cell wall biosynthesis
MYSLLLLLGLLTVLFGIIPLILSYRFKKYVYLKLNNPTREYSPKASVILPCKGIDPGFEENINALLTQDYPDYEVIFVTATDEDPAYSFLDKFIKNTSYTIPLKLIISGLSSLRGQKINNIIEALEHVRDNTEIFVFVDSDVRPEKNFLRNLVNPLQYQNIGASTGIRWYLPKHGNLGSILRSLWAAGAYPLLINQRYNFVYGGANAIKKETFAKGNIKELLDHSISDTFAIAGGVKSIYLDICFVPQCVVISHEDSTLSETIEWTNRQTIISRIYSSPFWWTVFLTYSFSNVMLLLGIIILSLWIIGEGTFLLPGMLMLSLIPLEILNASFLLPVIQHMIPQHSKQIETLKWKYYLSTPLASILIMINSIVSLTTNEITWRGVRYRLVSPTQTEILSED